MSGLGVLAAGIAATGSLVAQGVKNYQDKKRYERQLKDERANWNMQNQYNSPSAQMARLKSAGLNPNLVYQQGGALSGAGEMTTPSYPDAPLMDYQNIAQMALQADSALASIENTKANTRKTNAEAYDLEEHNKTMDKTLGKLKDYQLLNQEERNYYAGLFGVNPDNVSDLSVRGASMLSDLRTKFHNNRQLDLIVDKLYSENNQAMYQASMARFAMMLEMLNLDTEARKRGYNVSYSDGYMNGDPFSVITQISKNPKKMDMVLEMFLRELKEVKWQSSDAKHIIDATNQSIGSISSAYNSFKPTRQVKQVTEHLDFNTWKNRGTRTTSYQY